MKIDFLSIRAKNFGPIGNQFETLPLNKSAFTVIVGKNGTGKAQPVDSLVLTPNGFKQIGSLVVGDDVIDPTDGSIKKINGVFPQGEKQVYKITFSDGRTVDCCKEHLWKVWGAFGGETRNNYWNWKVLNVDQIINHIGKKTDNKKNGKNKPWRVYIPLANLQDNANQANLPIDPYVMGALLGDGGFSQPTIGFTSADSFIVDKINDRIYPQKLSKISEYGYLINAEIRHSHCNQLRDNIRQLGLYGLKSEDKFIPEVYFQGNFNQRLELLQGLMDTDGTVGKIKDLSYTSCNQKLIKDVQRLVWSLGGIAKIRQYKERRFDLRIRLSDPSCAFSLPRKINRCENYQYSKSLRLEIINIEPLDKYSEMVCISVDSNDHLYITNNYVVTHNTTWISALIYALYGKPYNKKLTLGQLINDTNKKNLVVEIAFKIGNDLYVIRRGQKPKLFEIFKNKQLVEPDPSIGDYQKQLEETILRQSMKTFSQINVITKATYTQFMDLDAKDRRAVVEDILDSRVYSNMQLIGKEQLKLLTKEVEQVDKQIDIQTNRLEDVSRMIRQYEQRNTGLIEDIDRSISKYNNTITPLTERLNQAEGNLEQTLIKMEALVPSRVVEQLNDKIDQLKTSIRVASSVVDSNQKTISKIDTFDNCPHCQQVIDVNHKNEIINAAKETISENYQIMQTNQTQLNKLLKKKQERDQLQSQANDLINEISKIHSMIDNAKSTIKDLENQKNNIINSSQPTEMPNIEEIQQTIDQLTITRDSLLEDVKTYKKAISMLGDDGLKASVINKYIPVINSVVNRLLESMNMFVDFTLDSEFNETINAINRENFTYHSFSEGQKMRIDLAILLTWREIAKIRNSMSTNLFFLDEIADGSLDDDGMNEFIAILKQSIDSQNVFVISHKESTIDNDVFDTVIKVSTEGNFAKYEYQ